MELLERSPVLISPRPSLLLTRVFDVADPSGVPLGTIMGTSTDLELRDTAQILVAAFHRPWVVLHTEVAVTDATGEWIGGVRQVSPLGRIRFALFDAQGSAGVLEPDGIGATLFRVRDERGDHVGDVRRRRAFWMRTGDYELSVGIDRVRRLLAMAGVIAIDKAVRRRRAGGGGAGTSSPSTP